MTMAAATSQSSKLPATLKTIDGKPPLVIGHRGFPGLYPEETAVSYEKAADAGADSLEVDMVMTRDCVLVARHNPWLSDNTNIVDVAKKNPAVATRKRTMPGRWQNVKWPGTPDKGPHRYLTDLPDAKIAAKQPSDRTENNTKSVLKTFVVDGQQQDGGDFTRHTGDWAVSDFTFAELKKWIGGTTYDARELRPTALNGKFPILSVQEVIDIARKKTQELKRPITVYIETKNPIWNNRQAIANGCGKPGTRPFENAVIKLLETNGLNTRGAPIFLQSFDPESLKYLRRQGAKPKAVQLIDGNDVNYKTGEVIYNSGDYQAIVSGRPYSWTIAGKPAWFGEMLTPAGLAEIKKYADGIGPWKPMVIRLSVLPWKDGAKLSDVNRAVPSNVVADAHKAGLFVHVYTFRNEKKYLAGIYNNDPMQEHIAFFKLGVDGIFTDFPDTGVAARQKYLQDVGYKPAP